MPKPKDEPQPLVYSDRSTWMTCGACDRKVHPLTGICGCNDR